MATKVEMLEEARSAYHQLMMGRNAIVVVDQNGERVEYQRANAQRLAAYIRQLEMEVAAENGDPIPGGPGFIYM